ncbi:MAG: hypothetical protein PHF84_08210 [bacterium]|nr:hypothetical protein [bacterium]
MKKLTLVTISFFLVPGLLFAEGATTRASKKVKQAEVLVLKGDIIDNMCADRNTADLAGFITKHTKECALKPSCAASGYSIFSKGRLYQFDKPGSRKVETFLRKERSKLQVTVKAKKNGDLLELYSIGNGK